MDYHWGTTVSNMPIEREYAQYGFTQGCYELPLGYHYI